MIGFVGFPHIILAIEKENTESLLYRIFHRAHYFQQKVEMAWKI